MTENKNVNGLQVFTNGEFGKINVIEIDGEPWFVASEVCNVLGYSNSRDAISRFCKGVVKRDILSNGGKQSYSIIPERDLYRLVIRSKMPKAEKFEEWVVGEVLPTIRKTGGYQVQHKLPTTFAEALRQLADETEAKEKALLVIEENRPKVEFFDQVTDSTDAVDMAGAAKVLNMGIGRTKLFAFLREEKILMANNIPYQEMIDRGYFRVIEQKYSTTSGEMRINFKTVVYQRGLDFIRKRYMEKVK